MEDTRTVAGIGAETVAPGAATPAEASIADPAPSLLRRALDLLRAGTGALSPADQEVVRAALWAEAARARNDVDYFVEYVFGVRQAPFHREWQRAMGEHQRVLIVSPRDHGKSVQAIARVLWELGRNPELRIKLVAQSDAKAIERLYQIRDMIERSRELHAVFPRLRPAQLTEWTKTRIVVQRRCFTKDASIEAVGITSSSTGGRADLIVYDDVVDLKNAIQMPALRETVKQAFRAVWSNMLEPGGRAVFLATLWHQSDLTHELLVNPEWRTLRFDIGGPGDPYLPLWPAKWPREALMAREREIGTREFARAFRNQALSDDEALVPRAVMERCMCPALKVSDVRPEWPKYVGVDLAIGQSNSACYTVIFTIAVDDRGRRWVVDIRRGRFTSPETARQVIEVAAQHKPNVIMVENNGVQEGIIQWIREVGGESLPIQSFTTGANKRALDIGLPSLRVEMENGAWICPTGDMLHEPGCECGRCVWLEEMTTYPIGRFTDVVMGCWFSREAARLGGVTAACLGMDPGVSPRWGGAMEGEGQGQGQDDGQAAPAFPPPRGNLLGIPRPAMPRFADLLFGCGLRRLGGGWAGGRKSVWERAAEDTKRAAGMMGEGQGGGGE